jgi:hypothetical protein
MNNGITFKTNHKNIIMNNIIMNNIIKYLNRKGKTNEGFYF